VCFRSHRPSRRRQQSPRRGAEALRSGLILAVALSATANRSNAQTDWRADAALTRLRPAGASNKSAASLSGLAQQQLGSVTPILSVAATIAGDSVAAAQLLMGVKVLPPWTDRAPIDVGAVYALYGIAAGDRGQSRMLYARQHLLLDRGGYWIGGAFGQIDREASFASDAIDVGAWLTKGRTRLTATLSTTGTDDREVFQNTALRPHPFATSVRVADAMVTVEYSGDRFDFDASAGGRVAVAGLDGSRGFASFAVGMRVAQRARAVAAFGSQLADPLRGTPEWRYASIGMRFANARATTGIPAGHAGPALEATRTGDGRARITIAAPASAQRVELAGSLTGWEPVALERGLNGWEITLSAPPGIHRVQVRVNGGEWRVPANLTASRDEFGKRSGLIVLP
jgi:hypothetical protein